MDANQIRSLIRYACRCCGVPELEKGIHFAFNNEFRATLADACYVGDKAGEIRFGNHMWEILTKEQRTELIIHEVCHIIHDYKYDGQSDLAHGKRWKTLMKVCGFYNPTACLEVDF